MAAQRGSPRAASYFHISDNLYIKFDNNDKKGTFREPVAKFDIIPKGFISAANTKESKEFAERIDGSDY